LQRIPWPDYNEHIWLSCQHRLVVKVLVPSYNRYSHHARRALSHAGALVVRLHHPLTDTGHLLVGVMETRGSIGYQILHDLELNAPAAIEYLKKLAPQIPAPPEEPPNADDLNAALAYAADESAWLGHHYIGTEHLLLGITRGGVGNARELLRYLKISPEQVRRRVRRALDGGAKELDLQAAKRSARLSELSRRAITAAEQLSVSMDHQSVGLGHLLLVMLMEERSPISALLRESGLDENQLRAGLDKAEAPLLVSIEVVLDRALDQAESLGSHYTGTEHLLLTLAADENGQALLRSQAIDPESVRQRIRQRLQAE
jgi:ATP-dependent Clp protease ATP-binding subunit ClpA